jgi:peptidoglycan/xylan/chitin deacetylase (PgdA/CDA1 family)
MHNTGNDPSIVNRVSEGYKNGLFELALHGWDQINYTKLDKDEQRISLLNANEKCKGCLEINQMYSFLHSMNLTMAKSKQ